VFIIKTASWLKNDWVARMLPSEREEEIEENYPPTAIGLKWPHLKLWDPRTDCPPLSSTELTFCQRIDGNGVDLTVFIAKVYRRRFLSTPLAATLLADGAAAWRRAIALVRVQA
jgi:hypothetical protein